MLLLISLLLGCGEPYGGACASYARTYCDTCETKGDEKAYCTCVETGELTASDFGDDRMTDEEAQQACDAVLIALDYPSPDSSADCKQGLVLLREYEQDACDYVGF